MKTKDRWIFVILAALLIGCGRGDGPELGTVHGRVTLDGNPLPKAKVTFTPMDESGARPAAAITDNDGNYELKYSVQHNGAPPGKYQVQITTATTTSDDQGNDVEVPEKLPAKYNASTELVKEVQAGDNTIDFPLDSKGKVYKGEKKPRRQQLPPSCE